MISAQHSRFLISLLFLTGPHFFLVSSQPDSCEGCETDLANSNGGLSLLQTASKRTLAWPPGPALIQPALKTGQSKPRTNHAAKAKQNQQPKNRPAVEVGTARAALPKHLYKLGLKVLGKEEILDAVVAGTRLVEVPQGGVNISFRIPTEDGFDGINGYGLNSLDSTGNSNGMINMLDIGGNLGRVTIAAFKMYPKQMRIVVLEPVPSTYFLLRWNLWLNGIPHLTESEFQADPEKAGVVAVDHGIASKDGKTVGLCFTPPWTMGARICDCSMQKGPQLPEKWKRQCLPMVGNTVDHWLSLFGDERIDFLKMDCEGCERDAIPMLSKHIQQYGPRIVRFAGELHEQANDIENFACKFEGGQWFQHVCHVQGDAKTKGFFKTVRLSERCLSGASRASCRRKFLDAGGADTGNLFEDTGVRGAVLSDVGTQDFPAS